MKNESILCLCCLLLAASAFSQPAGVLEKTIVSGDTRYFLRQTPDNRVFLLARKAASGGTDTIPQYSQLGGPQPVAWDICDSTLHYVRLYDDHTGMRYADWKVYSLPRLNALLKGDPIALKEYLSSHETTLIKDVGPLFALNLRIAYRWDTLSGPLYFDAVAGRDSIYLCIALEQHNILYRYSFPLSAAPGTLRRWSRTDYSWEYRGPFRFYHCRGADYLIDSTGALFAMGPGRIRRQTILPPGVTLVQDKSSDDLLALPSGSISPNQRILPPRPMIDKIIIKNGWAYALRRNDEYYAGLQARRIAGPGAYTLQLQLPNSGVFAYHPIAWDIRDSFLYGVELFRLDQYFVGAHLIRYTLPAAHSGTPDSTALRGVQPSRKVLPYVQPLDHTMYFVSDRFSRNPRPLYFDLLIDPGGTIRLFYLDKVKTTIGADAKTIAQLEWELKQKTPYYYQWINTWERQSLPYDGLRGPFRVFRQGQALYVVDDEGRQSPLGSSGQMTRPQPGILIVNQDTGVSGNVGWERVRRLFSKVKK